jgi:hypothetical protein
MSNQDKYDKHFINLFGVEMGQLKALEYQSIETWDSVGHMSLIVSIEEEFGISFEMDDILDFSSYSKGIEILNKYLIEL